MGAGGLEPTRVGVVGSGQVGRALARGFASRGHEVRIGSRDPGAKPELQEWLASEAGQGVSGATFEEVASASELLVLATDWRGTESAIDLAGRENFGGKVLIDVTNPLQYREGGPPALALGHTDSGGEQVQRWLPEALVVKAFNIVGNGLMVDPQLPGGPPDMFIAGEDEEAKATVEAICRDFGWNVHDLGGIEGARLLEPLAMVWITVGFREQAWMQAFKLLRP
jgi:8-hydroxy-5-deazaflavin:NADPH oxidoreductase